MLKSSSKTETVKFAKLRDDAPELYWKIYDILSPWLIRAHRLKVKDAHNLPQAGKGGVIIAAIHNGALDGAFIALSAAHRGRAVRFIGDEELCNAPVIGKLIRGVGLIPVVSRRGAGTNPELVRQALSEAAEAIQDGGTLCIYPEGVIRPFFNTRKSFPFKTGVIRIAVTTHAPIIPVWAQGAGAIFPWISPFDIKGKKFYGAIPLWTPKQVTVHFGKPFHVKKSLTLESPAEELKKEAERLMRAADVLRNS